MDGFDNFNDYLSHLEAVLDSQDAFGDPPTNKKAPHSSGGTSTQKSILSSRQSVHQNGFQSSLPSRNPNASESRYFLKDLVDSQGISALGASSFILAVVIAKQDPKSFLGKDCVERWRLSFTIRDAPKEWINVTCWGDENWIKKTSEAFTTGDAVRIHGARATKLEDGDFREKFAPTCPLPFVLSVSVPPGSVEFYIGRELRPLLCLAQMPITSANASLSLNEAMQTEPGSRVNILVGLKSLSAVRTIETKFGRRVTATLFVMDKTCRHFAIKTWNNEEVQAFQRWEPKTVVYFHDVKIIRDDFHDRLVAQTDVKTIAQPSPESAASRQLSEFMADVNVMSMCWGEVDQDVNLDSVDFVLQVKEIHRLLDEIKEIGADAPFPSRLCVVYGLLTSFPVDAADETAFLLRRCAVCKKRVRDLEMNACEACARQEKELEFGVGCDVSDQSGTLPRVWIPNSVVKEMLQGMTPIEFLGCKESVKTQLKWSRLLVAGRMTLKIDRTRNLSPMLQLLRWENAETDGAQMDSLVHWE